MNDHPPGRLLTFPNANEHVLSIRAKALVHEDEKSIAVLQKLQRIAPSDATVLIIGETGTGKELVARYIHDQSARKGPFVAINCGAFNENVIEAELFGHEIGAFTGAQQARPGWFEAADGGTLFLDEIGDMPLPLQVKLLRVLQERQVVRLGSRKAVPVDVRLVAATNVELERAVEAGHFRRDLYYRLSVAPVSLPPLRDRRGDILPLVRHFVEVYRRKMGIGELVISSAAEKSLLEYWWPGNIRELENVVHFALIMCRDGVLQPEDLRLPVVKSSTSGEGAGGADWDVVTRLERAVEALLESELDNLYERVERVLVETAYHHTGGNQVRTAKRLDVTRNVLRAQLKRFGLLGATTAASDEDDTEGFDIPAERT